MEFKANIHGLKEIEALLKKLPDKPAKLALDAGLRAGGNVILREAKARAPELKGPPRIVKTRKKGRSALERKEIKNLKGYDPTSPYLYNFRIIAPGLLRNCLYVKKVKPKDPRSVDFVLTVKGIAFYAHFVEFGTKKMAARPFMRPALDTKGEEAIAKIREVTLKRIVAEAQRLSGELGTKKFRRRK